MKRRIYVIAALLISSLITIGQENFNFTLDVPDGWKTDRSVEGFHCVYYPATLNWRNSPSVIYANLVTTGDKYFRNLHEVIDYDLENYKIAAPHLDLIYGEPMDLLTKEFTSQFIYLYGVSNGSDNLSCLALAYIQVDEQIINLMLHANTKKEFNKSLPVFTNLVSSLNVNGKSLAIAKK